MTKAGIIYLPMTIYCPDRWRYAFDGHTLEVVEEFDDVPEEGMEMAVKMMSQLGYAVKREGNILSFKKELSQDDAIKFSFSEFLGQAVVLGFIPREAMVHILEEIACRPQRIPSTLPEGFLKAGGL